MVLTKELSESHPDENRRQGRRTELLGEGEKHSWDLYLLLTRDKTASGRQITVTENYYEELGSGVRAVYTYVSGFTLLGPAA